MVRAVPGTGAWFLRGARGGTPHRIRTAGTRGVGREYSLVFLVRGTGQKGEIKGSC